MKGSPMFVVKKEWRSIVFLCAMLCILCYTPQPCAAFTENQRQTGEATLDELLMGANRFVIRVATGGCTDKNSFRVHVQKDESATAPHYVLTINRIVPDECKALFPEGTLVLFDLEKDLGITGPATYSVTNSVFSSDQMLSPDESLFSGVEKAFPQLFQETQPDTREGSEDASSIDNGHFQCDIPATWRLQRDQTSDEAAGIFEINLTRTDKAQPEDGEPYFFPDPLIYVGYYSGDNVQGKTYESFIRDYEDLVEKRKGSENSRMTPPKKIDFNGKEATDIEYEVFQAVPRGPLVTIEYWLKDKFIIIKADRGFYVLAYKSPVDFYDTYLPVFEQVAASFTPQH